MIVQRKTQPHRRSENRDVTRPCLVALNGLPGVRVFRNLVSDVMTRAGTYIKAGLSEGSADLVGVVSCECVTDVENPGPHAVWCPWADPHRDPVLDQSVGRFFAIETKLPGYRDWHERDLHQKAWAETMRARGGFVAIARSVPEAVAAVRRCRDGLPE